MNVIALSDSRPTLERLRKYLTAHDDLQTTLERSSSFYNWQLSSAQCDSAQAAIQGARALNLHGLAVGESLSGFSEQWEDSA